MTPRGTKTPPRPPGAAIPYVYAPPAYTQFPNEILDTLMAQLSGAEFKVLAYVARRTFGFHTSEARIGLAQLCNGLMGAGGNRLDYGTGLARSTAQAAVDSLEAQGLLMVRRYGGTAGVAWRENTYTLLTRDGSGGVVPADELALGQGEQAAEHPPVLVRDREPEPTPDPIPKIGIGGDSTYTKNRYSPSPISGKAIRGKKESVERKPPVVPQAKTKANGNVSAVPCLKCWGSGLYYGSTLAPVSHLGTLASVQSKLESAAVALCDCAAGRGWAELVEDAAKGDGVHKSQLGGAAHWTGGGGVGGGR